MKIGVIGFGSIGKRHCENLISMGYSDITLLRSRAKSNPLGLNEVYDEDKFMSVPFDFVILSNPTSHHFRYLKQLIPLRRNLLVEKPIAAAFNEAAELAALLKNYDARGMCAYNLRFHPCVVKINELLSGNVAGKVYSVRFFVGQYLPDWRPGVDYRESYSAKKSFGGGVILDLIHEIDLAEFFCGSVQTGFHAIVDKISDLEIDSEDIAEIHYKSAKGISVSIHLDYLTKGYSRYFELLCENGNVHCDLFNAEIKISGDNNNIWDSYLFKDFRRNDMYISMIRYYIECLKSGVQPVPTLSDGLSSLTTALNAKSFRV